MARHEQDREDLIREATALVERIELKVPGLDESVVIGFRRDGAGAIYFGQDLVFQFNSKCELRRGFFQRRLVKAVDGRLVSLERQRTAETSVLASEAMCDEECAEFLAAFTRHRQIVLAATASKAIQILGQVPADRDVLGRAISWLDDLSDVLTIAKRPNVGG